jgi:hypothetical protein
MYAMPLSGYKSLCDSHATIIKSKDAGNPQTHYAHNRKRKLVTQYQIDGVVIKDGNKCDFLVMNEETSNAYLIELKGSDMVHAAKQLDETAKKLASQLAGYFLNFRIVANKCKTQEIESTKFKKYKIDWAKKYGKNHTFKYASSSTMSEDI